MDELLKKYPSLTSRILSLHPFQVSAIDAILGGNDALVIAPTGKGKSLIYQIAGQELPGTTIVVSPLIALIEEQVDILGADLAISVNSTLRFAEQRQLLQALATGDIIPKFIFVSPERLQNYFFRSALKRSGLSISMLVVDEAHCISQWGFDFRPEYSQIKVFLDFIRQLGQTPVTLAMTATIGAPAQHDIVNEFNISPFCIYKDKAFLRNELKLHFVKVNEEKEKSARIIEILGQHRPRKTLIYFYDKSHCRKISERLRTMGYRSATFYSGMDNEDKKNNYLKFKDGEIDILCATSAFGMGMNIPDIDMVIHHRLPDSIEEYYQQVGRAARDKVLCPQAHCFALWSTVNLDYKHEEFIPAVILNVEQIKEAFRTFDLTGHAGQAQSLEYSNYIRQNLGRIRYALEKRGVLRTIGEVNGTPRSIIFNEPNPYWEEIVRKMHKGNSFIRAAKNAGIALQDLIDYIFGQELDGRIKKFPAMEKKIFVVSDYNEVPLEAAYDIIEESIRLSEFKDEQVNKLTEMIHSDNIDNYILSYFQNINDNIH